jgi:phosphonate transport system substrate-binding protein
MERLRFASCQAPNSEYIGDAVVECLRAELHERLGYEVEWVCDISWQERYVQLEQGGLHVVWICGAPYVRLRERQVDVAPLAAPVWRAPRYEDRPVYYSDVVVNVRSPFRCFVDLRGGHWAYNSPESLSGYECVRGELARLRAPRGFFGKVTEAGSHEHALELILAQEVDGGAIDSTVLEEAVRRNPQVAAQIRIVHQIGPSPMPPWVAGPAVPADLRYELRRLLIGLSATPEGRRVLADTPVERFAAVDDTDYNPVRALLARAAHVRLGPEP